MLGFVGKQVLQLLGITTRIACICSICSYFPFSIALPLATRATIVDAPFKLASEVKSSCSAGPTHPLYLAEETSQNDAFGIKIDNHTQSRKKSMQETPYSNQSNRISKTQTIPCSFLILLTPNKTPSLSNLFIPSSPNVSLTILRTSSTLLPTLLLTEG